MKQGLTTIALLFGGILLGFILRGYVPKLALKNENKVAINNPSTLTKAQNEVLASFGKNEVVIKADQVMINEGWDSPNPLQVELTPKEYPDLFLPAGQFTRIHVQEITDVENSEIKLLYLSRQRPDHGSISDGYFVTVDPVIGKVVNSGWVHLFGSVHLYSSSNGSALPLAEYTRYDRAQQKYVLINNKHRKDFEKLKAELNDLNAKEICRLSGESITIDEALKVAKDTDKCGDLMLGSNTDKPADDFITIGQYKEILKNVQRIIDGENIKIFERI
ncbi:MAG: hypothetical protein HONDAALG_04095 [Gammaproteobacteria bacterium]|nr:hypothetical protein [Gammaproteobacteria bacterium]